MAGLNLGKLAEVKAEYIRYLKTGIVKENAYLKLFSSYKMYLDNDKDVQKAKTDIKRQKEKEEKERLAILEESIKRKKEESEKKRNKKKTVSKNAIPVVKHKKHKAPKPKKHRSHSTGHYSSSWPTTPCVGDHFHIIYTR